MSGTDTDKIWGELSRISRRGSLYPLPEAIPFLHDEIDGFSLRFRRFHWGIFVILLFVGAMSFIIAYIKPIQWFWAYGQLAVALAVIVYVLLAAALSCIPLSKVRWQNQHTVIRRRILFGTREISVPSDDLAVVFDVATGNDAWPQYWLGKGMILLKHKNFPNQPIIVVVARGKRLWSLCNELSRRQGLTIEDKTSEPIVLADGRKLSVCCEAIAGESASFSGMQIRFHGNDVVKLGPKWQSLLLWSFFLIMGLFMIANGGIHGMIGIPLLFALVGGIGLLFSISKVVFDRNNETVVVQRWLRDGLKSRPVYSFDDIAAVQLCSHNVRGQDAADYIATEMNLVLADPPGERIMLTCHNKEDNIRMDAQKLAEFLGKPLLDHTCPRGDK